MSRKTIVSIVAFSLLFILMLAAVADIYIRKTLHAQLTPLTTTYSRSLPGVTITENGLNADFFCNKAEKQRKTVIILGGSEGGKHWSTNTAYLQRLLDQDFCVMVLAYFHAPGLPNYLREIPLEYFEKAFQWLSVQAQVAPDDYAVIGHSRGGELTLLLASRYPQVKAVVAIAPSSVIFPGSPVGLFDLFVGQHSAWSYHGEPLDYVPWVLSLKNAPGLVTLRQRPMFEQALLNQSAVKSATIPVENIHGPILCLSATNDEVWPSTMMCDQVMGRLRQNNFPYSYQHSMHNYTHGWCGLEGCWSKVVEFLNQNFK